MPAFEIATLPSSVVVARLQAGEELIQAVAELASRLNLRGGLVVAIGGLRSVELGVYKGEKYDIESYEASEGHTIELTSALGSVAVGDDGKPSIHVHATVSLPDHRPASGHMIRGVVGPLVELFIVGFDATLRRTFDSSIGLSALSA